MNKEIPVRCCIEHAFATMSMQADFVCSEKCNDEQFFRERHQKQHQEAMNIYTKMNVWLSYAQLHHPRVINSFGEAFLREVRSFERGFGIIQNPTNDHQDISVMTAVILIKMCHLLSEVRHVNVVESYVRFMEHSSHTYHHAKNEGTFEIVYPIEYNSIKRRFVILLIGILFVFSLHYFIRIFFH